MEPLDSRLVYEGYGVDVEVRRYRRADGTEVERQVIEHPGSVAILAHDGEFVYLVAQPREAVEEDALLEIPAGTLDRAGESELECARRELAEEAELDEALPRIRDASTLIALMALRDRRAGSSAARWRRLLRRPAVGVADAVAALGLVAADRDHLEPVRPGLEAADHVGRDPHHVEAA
jgi:8-oxo-dGTP pyrophosphatase MutT (NUDIX family)